MESSTLVIVFGVGIAEHKPLTVEAIGEVQFGAHQVDVALLVYHHLDTVLLHDFVAIQFLVPDI